MKLHEILTQVAKQYLLPPSALLSSSRPEQLVKARHEMFYRAMQETSHSAPVIARTYQRDPSSVLHGAKRHAVLHGLPMPRGATFPKRLRAPAPLEGG